MEDEPPLKRRKMCSTETNQVVEQDDPSPNQEDQHMEMFEGTTNYGRLISVSRIPPETEQLNDDNGNINFENDNSAIATTKPASHDINDDCKTTVETYIGEFDCISHEFDGFGTLYLDIDHSTFYHGFFTNGSFNDGNGLYVQECHLLLVGQWVDGVINGHCTQYTISNLTIDQLKKMMNKFHNFERCCHLQRNSGSSNMNDNLADFKRGAAMENFVKNAFGLGLEDGFSVNSYSDDNNSDNNDNGNSNSKNNDNSNSINSGSCGINSNCNVLVEMKKDFDGMYENGMRNGFGIIYLDDGGTLQGVFKNDQLNDEHAIYTFDDKISQLRGIWENGKMQKARFVIIDNNFSSSSSSFSSCSSENGKSNNHDHNNNSVKNNTNKIANENKNKNTSSQNTNTNIDINTNINSNNANTNKDKDKKDNSNNASVNSVSCNSHVITNSSEQNKGVVNERFWYKEDIATETVISEEPLLSDPFESSRVYVSKSSLVTDNDVKNNDCSQDGLFAKRDIKCGECISFYNGIHISHELVNKREWKYNDNTLSINDEFVIDIPKEYSTIDKYCATLGHKANHSFKLQNAQYEPYWHPRFGSIKCLRSIKSINKNEEIFVDYGYQDEFPMWYQDKYKHKAHSQSLLM